VEKLGGFSGLNSPKNPRQAGGGKLIFMSTHPSAGERYNILKYSGSRYQKASLYPVLEK
jgi:hypothetical protein